VTNILLASEGRPFSKAAIAQASAMAGKSGKINLISIARIWGVALGFPNPWLLPSKQEWAQQRSQVADAIAELKRLGFEATGVVAATRNPSKRINAQAARLNCDTIVMGSDPPRHWLLADFYWSQEPYRVKKRAKLPVELVIGSEE
jgi:nucleotide-binding universal stress UspA family protein